MSVAHLGMGKPLCWLTGFRHCMSIKVSGPVRAHERVERQRRLAGVGDLIAPLAGGRLGQALTAGLLGH